MPQIDGPDYELTEDDMCTGWLKPDDNKSDLIDH